jgi:glycosyltransferase involved in cell wall biosynthesis
MNPMNYSYLHRHATRPLRIAFISLPGMKPGGIPVYMTRLFNGLKNIPNVDPVIITLGESSYKAYISAGASNDDIMTIYHTDKNVVEMLNHADFIVYEQCGGYGDYSYHKHSHNDRKPWYYNIVENVKTKSCSFVHSVLTYKQHSPYIDVWENANSFFVTQRLSIANAYAGDRGVVPIGIIPVPIELKASKFYHFDDKQRVIASTQRMSYEKRYKYIIEAMNVLNGWQFNWHSGKEANDYFAQKEVETLCSNVPNTALFTQSTLLDYDSIFKEAMYVYNSTKFPDNGKGGVESSILEGAARGCIPLISEENTDMYPDGYPLDACVKFDMGAGSESNIAELILSMTDMELRRKRAMSWQFLRENKDQVMIAYKFMNMIEEFL